MALFGKKKGDEPDPKDDGAGGAGGGGSGGPGENGSGEGARPVYSADKASRFFSHAQTVHDSTQYEYAMQLWLSGLRQDPTSMRGLESFFKSCAAFLMDSGGKGPSKETLRQFDGKGDLEKFLNALLAWGMKPTDALLAVRATEMASKLGLTEQTYWLGDRAIDKIRTEKKPRKDLYLKLVPVFTKVGAVEKAVEALDAAVKLDPSDGPLAAELRNLSAQATMSKGGYEQTGQAGGFRANIRDLDKQRQLEDQERIVKTEETIDRLLKAEEEDYLRRPEDPAAINKYAKRLIERGRPEDEKRAAEVLKKAYETTKQFRFREMSGDLLLRRAYRKLGEYRDKAAAAADNAVAQTTYKRAQAEYNRMELEEYKLRVEAYPTDLGLKFEVGKRYFALGDMDNAIPLFQESQHDAKRRVESQHYLAQAFQKIEYLDEAISTFRQALDAHRAPTDETGMALRYGLMCALQKKAEGERELPIAEEADKLASDIAIHQFNYRDIRARRDSLKKLIAELKNRGGGNGEK